ncbi:uncharacterized protein LOC130691922 isoform X2 [Daphnia carinata]|uniref:uncharacterized protein LOC130691922 isoform X2 n=1 Tax=Daphnia carinata TaxID=120202 RepID=UPI00257FAC27|nr:uncharacterized protein LOC130691922 isoform X2 [Daphnia carinata]
MFVSRPEHQEIIEFPAVLLDCKTGKVEDEFQSYCRPILHPLLTDYCLKLTGITQDIVDQAPSFHETFASFNEWLQGKDLGSKFSFAIVTDGSKDMGHFLKRQCALSNILFPEYGKYWVNIRKTFSNFYKVGDMQKRARRINETVLNAMIREMGYQFKGRAHSGLDDARNIACIVQGLLKDGASIVFNEKLPEESAKETNGKGLFCLPVFQPEFGIIKDTLKSNFPTKNCPTNVLVQSSVNETAIMEKSCTKSTILRGETLGEKILETASKKAAAAKPEETVSELAPVMIFTENEGDKTRINGAVSNISFENVSSINITTKIVTEDVQSKSNKKPLAIEPKSKVSKIKNAAVNATKSRNKKKSAKTTSKGTPTKILDNVDPTMTSAVSIPEKKIPVKTLLQEAPVKTPANEILIKTSEKKPSAQTLAKSAPAKNGKKKTSTMTTVNSSPTPSAQCTVQSSKAQAKKSPLFTATEKSGNKTSTRHRVKVLPTEDSAKEADTNVFPNISESSNHEKTAELLAKELKLAKKKFYGKTQYAPVPIGELKKALKNIENLKKRLNAVRSVKPPCVPSKPLVAEGVTIAKGSDVVEKRNTSKASKKATGSSQKNKASSSRVGNNSESKDSLETAVRETQNPLPDKMTASFLQLDVNPRPREQSVCDKAKEELFFQIFENVLDKMTMRDQAGKE